MEGKREEPARSFYLGREKESAIIARKESGKGYIEKEGGASREGKGGEGGLEPAPKRGNRFDRKERGRERGEKSFTYHHEKGAKKNDTCFFDRYRK